MIKLALVLTYFSLFWVNIPAEVTVTNLKDPKAKVYMAVYQNEKTFLDVKSMFKGVQQSPLSIESVKLSVDLPAGDYAFAVFQDLNGNGVLDTNFMGIPSEPYGFSKNFKPRFSAPKFSDCKVTLNTASKSYSIKLLH